MSIDKSWPTICSLCDFRDHPLVLYAFCESQETKAKSKQLRPPLSVVSYESPCSSQEYYKRRNYFQWYLSTTNLYAVSRIPLHASCDPQWTTFLSVVSGNQDVGEFVLPSHSSITQFHITDGRQGLRYTFNEFTYQRSVVMIPNEYVFWTCGIWYKMTCLRQSRKDLWYG